MEPPTGATRIVKVGPDREVLAVRRARLRVIRGPDKGKQLELGQESGAVIGTDEDADLVLGDDSVSRRHVEIQAEPDGYVLRDLGSTNGVRVAGVRIHHAVLDGASHVISLGETDLQLTLLEGEVEHELSNQRRFGKVLGQSVAMRELFAQLEQAAHSDCSVILEGESGTGKEMIAENLHRISRRAQGPLVVVDCPAITPSLVESELFGVEKGAFTGATQSRPGLIEVASGGTLFLDEISELALDLQPKLLRVIEARAVRRVGDNQYRNVDLRIIAAANRDLAKCVAAGTFRKDLYYRLAVAKIRIPPLRRRREDIPLLARHFIEQLSPDRTPEQVLTPAVLWAFSTYPWPGNVRELRNAVERLVTHGDPDLATAAATRVGMGAPSFGYHESRRRALDDFERHYCEALLATSAGVVAHAAEHAGISRQLFHRLLRKHQLAGAPDDLDP